MMEEELINRKLMNLEIDDNERKKVLIIDIGVKHLGLCLALINQDYTFSEIVDINLIDITNYTHNNNCIINCELYHTKTFYDWLTHVFVEHTCFDESDIILIERQPPLGFCVVEQIIFGKYRYKSHLINPRNVHKFLGITNLDYENRKIFSEKKGSQYLSTELLCQLKTYNRQHDITDAICMLLYWLNKHNYEYKKKEQRKKMENFRINGYNNCFEYLETFRYLNRFPDI